MEGVPWCSEEVPVSEWTVMPDLKRAEPMARQLFSYYAGLIRSGELPEGIRLPSVSMIAGEFGVSPATAHRGVVLLRQAGLVRTDPTGSYVLQVDHAG